MSYWTYAGDGKRITFREHTSQEAAKAHYDLMRLGGPKRIGITTRKATAGEIEEMGWHFVQAGKTESCELILVDGRVYSEVEA